jgi:hypothetical protein
VLETVREGVTGTFYDDGDDPQALAAAVRGFDLGLVDPGDCVAAARGFGVARFQERLRDIVAATVAGERFPRAPERPIGGLLPLRGARREAHLMRIR